MTNKKAISQGIDKNVLDFHLFWVLLFVWITVATAHVLIGVYFLSQPGFSIENKVLAFSFVTFSYTMYYYSKGFFKKRESKNS